MNNLNPQESETLCREYAHRKYPLWLFDFAYSKYSHFRSAYKNNLDWKSLIDVSIENISKRNNFGIYWYDLGVRDPLLIEIYKSDRNWRVCKICNKIYHQHASKCENFDATYTCSVECNKESRLIGGERLSKSRLLYNNRDPIQYSKRHGIEIEEAIEIVTNSVRKTSMWCPEYWQKLGYSLEDANKEISRVQSLNSRRCISHWMKNGCTEEEAIQEVKNHQSLQGLLAHSNGFNPENSWLCIEYYIKRGYTEEEGYKLKNEKLLLSGEILSSIAQSKTKEERSSDNPRSILFYVKRGIDEEVGIKRIAEIYEKSRNKKFVSEISREFCSMLDPHFLHDKTYHDVKNKEFFIYSKERKGICFYDYTNTTKNFIVEFNGNYWHSPLNKNWTQEWDDIKNKTAADRGFKVFTVWELDYKANKTACVDQLVNEIKEWYENCKD